MTYEQINNQLEELKNKNNLRTLPTFTHDHSYAIQNGHRMLNLSSNDYLGLASDDTLRQSFAELYHPLQVSWSASSSRLLTGNYECHIQLEQLLARLYGKEAALVFNSGYHANSGILPALADSRTLILADKLVHASLIDGIRLSGATCIRYRHNNYTQLAKLLEERHSQFDSVLIVTESLFSMDGDLADLRQLVKLKKQYPNTWLYVDEAHAFGVRGANGLGYAEEQDCINDIDLLVGTFGKAAASAGAFVVCSQLIRDWLVNTMRPFIFTTALPPVNQLWTLFIVEQLASFAPRRKHLEHLSSLLQQALTDAGHPTGSASHIIPYTVGDSRQCILTAEQLQRHGFYALPVRPPTVPEGTSRIRFSLTAALSEDDIRRLADTVAQLSDSSKQTVL